MSQKIVFHDVETNEDVEFGVIEETRINNRNYLLVTEDESEDTEEAVAYILKDVSTEQDEQAQYVMVEDDEELEAVSKIFAELLDDVDIES